MKGKIEVGDEVIAKKPVFPRMLERWHVGTRMIVKCVRKVNRRWRVDCVRKGDRRRGLDKPFASIPMSNVVKASNVVWVVNQVIKTDSGFPVEIFNRVFSSYQKAYNFVKAEFAHDDCGEFDGEAFANTLFISNRRCDYNAEECDID